MTPQSEKYVDGSAFISVDDMRRGEYYYRHGPRAICVTINEGTHS